MAPNHEWGQFSQGQHLTRQLFPVVDGNIAVPEEPGLGVELDEQVVKKYRVG